MQNACGKKSFLTARSLRKKSCFFGAQDCVKRKYMHYLCFPKFSRRDRCSRCSFRKNSLRTRFQVTISNISEAIVAAARYHVPFVIRITLPLVKQSFVISVLHKHLFLLHSEKKHIVSTSTRAQTRLFDKFLLNYNHNHSVYLCRAPSSTRTPAGRVVESTEESPGIQKSLG